jgi:hypothetical protein
MITRGARTPAAKMTGIARNLPRKVEQPALGMVLLAAQVYV